VTKKISKLVCEKEIVKFFTNISHPRQQDTGHKSEMAPTTVLARFDIKWTNTNSVSYKYRWIFYDMAHH